MDHIRPYDKEKPKSEQIEEMFDNIASGYDFMNAAISFGLHNRWINKALTTLSRHHDLPAANQHYIIDLAAGTGDVTFRLAKLYPEARITGVDLSEGMLSIARKKADELGLENRVTFQQGDCLNLQFPDDTFDILTIAYGVRNFSDLPKGFSEFYRVLRPGGSCLILELSMPENKAVRPFYNLYAGSVIPAAAHIFTKDHQAYDYLPMSIKAMPPRHEIEKMLGDAGFKNVKFKSFTLGVVTCYIAVKPHIS